MPIFPLFPNGPLAFSPSLTRPSDPATTAFLPGVRVRSGSGYRMAVNPRPRTWNGYRISI